MCPKTCLFVVFASNSVASRPFLLSEGPSGRVGAGPLWLCMSVIENKFN